MLRPVGLVLATAAIALTAVAAPKGRVIRVERPSRAAAIPRFCRLTETISYCVGQPKDGERIALIDRDRGALAGEFRVDSSVGVAIPGICATPEPLTFKLAGSVVAGDPDLLATGHDIYGLREVSLDRRVARVLADVPSPRKNPGDEVELAIDADGDSDADYMLVVFACDADGTANNSGSSTRSCYDIYVERQDKLARVHQDILQRCI